MTTHKIDPSLDDRLKSFIQNSLLFPESEDEENFQAMAQDVFDFQFARNPVYRRFCESRGLISGIKLDWRAMPAISTSVFKQFEVTCLTSHERTGYFSSSGTTVHEPGKHFHHQGSLALYQASLVRWFRGQVIPNFPQERGGMFLSLTPSAAVAPRSSLVHMFQTVAKDFGSHHCFAGRMGPDGRWKVDYEQACRALDEAVIRQVPIVLVGTAFSFVQLLDHLRQGSSCFALPAGSRILETGGYKGQARIVLREELYAMMGDAFGIPNSAIIAEYGMSELSSQAYDHRFSLGSTGRNLSRVFRFPPWARVMIVSPETGEEVAIGDTGMVRVVDLANLYSVTAIQTEDLGICHKSGFEFIGRSALAEPRGCSLMTNA